LGARIATGNYEEFELLFVQQATEDVDRATYLANLFTIPQLWRILPTLNCRNELPAARVADV
jgi:hypothetical protein